MKEDEIPGKIDEVETEWPGLYSLFDEKGGKAVDVLYHAEPEDYNLPLSVDLYHDIDDKGLTPSGIHAGEFRSIVNFLSRAEILPTWNESSPFRIQMDKVDEENLATAYEYVSGEQYNFPETSEIQESRSALPEHLRS